MEKGPDSVFSKTALVLSHLVSLRSDWYSQMVVDSLHQVARIVEIGDTNHSIARRDIISRYLDPV